MKIVIDLKEETIKLPKEIKTTLEATNKSRKEMGKEEINVIDGLKTSLASLDIDLNKFKLTSVGARTSNDKLTKKDVIKYMEGIKDEEPSKYDEYLKIKDDNFLVIKSWFYKAFPSQSPFNK